jgi:hypothetical protein
VNVGLLVVSEVCMTNTHTGQLMKECCLEHFKVRRLHWLACLLVGLNMNVIYWRWLLVQAAR